MAINKSKNKLIQFTLPNYLADNLQALVNAFNDEGVKVTKSQIVSVALGEYITRVLAIGEMTQKKQKAKSEEEEPHGEKKDA